MRRAVDVVVLLTVAAVIVFLLAVWAPAVATGEPTPPVDDAATVMPTAAAPPALFPTKYQGHTARWWHDRYVAQLQRTQALKRTLRARATVTEAINLACTIYGNCAPLWRRARCESRLYRYAANANSSARGLFQFLTTGRTRNYYGGYGNGGTWATTPFAHFDVFSPYANALAAGWMIANGRGGEWDCR